MGSLGRAFRWSGSFWFAWVGSGAPKCGLVHSGSHEFTRAGLEIVGIIRVHICVALERRRVHSGSRVFIQAHLEIVVFIRVCVGSLWRTQWSSGSFGFAWVHSGAHRGIHSSAPKGRRVHWGSHGFSRAHLGVVGFIRVRVGSLRRASESPC